MTRAPRLARALATAVVASGVLLLAFAPAREGLGQSPAASATQTAKPGGAKTAGMVNGTMPSNLLKAEPFDRITLPDNSTWLVEAVAPRPLPVYDPAAELAKKKKEAKKKSGGPVLDPKGNLGSAKKEAAKKEKEEEIPEELTIHLVEAVGDVKDYKVKRADIKKVEYFEDLLMAEGDRLVQSKEFGKAFEHYLLVKNREPNWKGLEERVEKLLYEEGAWALIEQDRERGVRLLRELSARKADYPGLGDRLAAAYGGRINESFDKGQYAYARRVLHDLETIAPKTSVVREIHDRFDRKVRAVVEDAMKSEGPARLEKLTESLRILPTFEGAAEKYAETFKAMPTLDVAVIDLPHPAGPFIRNPAGARVTKLLYLPILANETEDATQGKLANQLVTSMEVGDIGRRIDLKLKTGPAWSDGSRQVAAIDVVRALSDRAQPRSPAYSARWADFLDRVEITDEQQVTVKLNRSILKPEAWLLGPVGPAHAAWDGRVPSSDGSRKPVGDGPFVDEAESDGVATYRLAGKEGQATTPTDKIRRIREVRYTNGTAALGALARGEVTMIEHVPSDRVPALQSESDLKVGQYLRPNLHRIALDGRNPLLKNRSLRRGIALAIDRKTILEETVLKRPIDANNLPSDGPMATDSYANSPDVPAYAYDMLLARMLVAAGKAEMKINSVKLRLEYPAVAEAQAAVPKIVEALKNAGVDVTAEEKSESEMEEALRAGRKFDMAYRVSKCVEPVWEIGPMLCPGFDSPSETDGLSAIASPRIMQLLLQLEHAQDWTSAQELVRQIDRECHDELPVIPLWQLQDYYAYRTRLKGPADTADHLYQGIDQWQIEPWFAKDPW